MQRASSATSVNRFHFCISCKALWESLTLSLKQINQQFHLPRYSATYGNQKCQILQQHSKNVRLYCSINEQFTHHFSSTTAKFPLPHFSLLMNFVTKKTKQWIIVLKCAKYFRKLQYKPYWYTVAKHILKQKKFPFTNEHVWKKHPYVFDDEHFNETMLQQQMQATTSTADALA